MGTTVLYMDTPEAASRAVADAVKAALSEAKITRREAASRSGIPLTTLERRLSGRSPFDVNELYVLATMAGVKVSDLVAATERGAA